MIGNAGGDGIARESAVPCSGWALASKVGGIPDFAVVARFLWGDAFTAHELEVVDADAGPGEVVPHLAILAGVGDAVVPVPNC